MLCVLRARDALKVQRRAAASIRNSTTRSYKNIGFAGRVREKQADALPSRWRGGDTAQDSLAIDPPRHQGCAEQERCDYRWRRPMRSRSRMVLDRMDEQPIGFARQLENERILVAKSILTEMYDTEYALQVPHHRLDEADWGKRLANCERGQCSGGSQK